MKRFRGLGIRFVVVAATLFFSAFEEPQPSSGRHRLQRLFSMFPGGWPGIGLLLLRVAVGVTVTIHGGVYLADRSHPTLATLIVGLLAVAAGISLLIGFLTPVASVLLGLGSLGLAFSWIPPPSPNLFDTKLSIIFVAIMTVVIVLLGPGAFSLDARLFGRREIIIPPASHPTKF